MVQINTNTGDLVGAGGTIQNINILIGGYVNASNDIPVGIVISGTVVDIRIISGSYSAPNYAAPSALVGPQGIRSEARNIQVSGFTSCGRLSRGPNNWVHANIGDQKRKRHQFDRNGHSSPNTVGK